MKKVTKTKSKPATTNRKKVAAVTTPRAKAGAGMPATMNEEQLLGYLTEIPASAVGKDGEMPSPASWPPYMVSLSTLAEMARVSMTTINNWMKRPGFPQRDSDGLIDAIEVHTWKTNRDNALKHRCRHCGQLNNSH